MRKEYDFSGARQGAVVKQPGKTRITIYLDDDVLQAFRERADETLPCETWIDDALVGIAASGRTPYVLGAMAYARQVGGLVIGLSSAATAIFAVFLGRLGDRTGYRRILIVCFLSCFLSFLFSFILVSANFVSSFFASID